MAHIPAERCLAIVQLLVEAPVGLALGEIAQRLGLPKSGVHRLLAALIEQGWAEQDQHSGSYRLTMRLTILGQRHYMATGIPDICGIDQLRRDDRLLARQVAGYLGADDPGLEDDSGLPTYGVKTPFDCAFLGCTATILYEYATTKNQ